MKRQWIAISLLPWALLWTPAASDGSPQPEAAGRGAAARIVMAFYRSHLATDRSFTERSLRAKRRWLTQELYGLLLYELRRATPKDEPPYIEGDPFTDSQEGPNKFATGKVTQEGPDAGVQVVFDWVEHGRAIAHRRCLVKLRKHRNDWRIADIVSSGGQSLAAQLRDLRRSDLAARKAANVHPEKSRRN